MPKKVTKKLKIPVPAKKMGFWVNKENLRKGERTIKTKKDKNAKDKVLVKRNRSGYEYSKTFTGYELDKDNLELQFASRTRVNPKAAARDLKIRAQDTRNAPVLTAKQFFDFTQRDVEGIDTPPKLEKTYDHDTMSAFINRVSYIAEDIGVDPKAISFKNMKGKKWGEATSTNSVRFDPELLEKSKDFQDKVIIHELLHLRYPNHSAMHKQLEKAYIQRFKDMKKPSSHEHVSKISDDLSIQELIDITRKNETELAKRGMKLTPEQRTFDPTYQHIKKEIAEAKVQISKKQFARLDAKKQSEKPKPYYIIDGTGQILHKSTSKEGAEKWFNKFKPTNTTYPEKRWKVISKEKYEQSQTKDSIKTLLNKEADAIAQLDLKLAKEQEKMKKEIQNSPEVLNKKIDEERRWRSLYLKEQVINSNRPTKRNQLQKKIDSCTKKIDRYEAKLNPEAKALSEEFTVLAKKYQPQIHKAQRGLDHKEASKLYSDWENEKEDLYRKIERSKSKKKS